MERHLLERQRQVPETVLPFNEPEDRIGASHESVYISTCTPVIMELAFVEQETGSVKGSRPASSRGLWDGFSTLHPPMLRLGQATSFLAQSPLCGVQGKMELNIFPTQVVFRYTPFTSKYHWAFNLHLALYWATEGQGACWED